MIQGALELTGTREQNFSWVPGLAGFALITFCFSVFNIAFPKE
jgi:hypothetical protein